MQHERVDVAVGDTAQVRLYQFAAVHHLTASFAPLTHLKSVVLTNKKIKLKHFTYNYAYLNSNLNSFIIH